MAKANIKSKSEYGLQLQEKQNIKKEYGLRERQFKNYFKKGKSSDQIFILLERRLDSVVFASGFAPTRKAARQMVNHGHILINNKKVNVRSYSLRDGDTVNIKEISKQKGMFADLVLRTKNHKPPSWITVDNKKMEIKIKGKPDMKEQLQPFNFQTVIEFYSR
ncbi:MAG: hypothetical protein A3F94_03335 [Candidatus Spechtbacteria bacterium RIFCSPLOWO2_12_FULL_38_22]|uniref:Small ribosomal subunit protein uS4 n=1 Tax=Candidatus Spechtbacteria bacterium RIFCSPLOWO2_12_FULL_38_22 TaxID=1802165 RepID=A0A1G2HJG9_9BACT|nr:MAG: hypothetical protein A2728_03175 [Candidatus Spechtbacteria bacterium RIFCSPHIGHO2_01_FULL_38_11]OGZ59233.1 MAG: hypothetical protein A3E58_01385 [Candidatus Spechtbacteria bacterium RIFCSPHIGHO2_12_FULL_38_30]OGZ60835.1 MAG: hypothetical protein A3A00_02615 [Candidatus Spechtbacteria bacterium RIFCSPLOWO2_01_FULL_38_20]OGZ62361.1 MAG: hypothetical protein A3F94_03335 [Candidatus Spechtbacteria bacterium RIFCSPLOWO2_12_FULL_38_22]